MDFITHEVVPLAASDSVVVICSYILHGELYRADRMYRILEPEFYYPQQVCEGTFHVRFLYTDQILFYGI